VENTPIPWAVLDAVREQNELSNYIEALEFLNIVDGLETVTLDEGWLQLDERTKMLNVHYVANSAYFGAVIFERDRQLTEPLILDGDPINYQWSVNGNTATSCFLFNETDANLGTINTFLIQGDSVTLEQKPGECTP
jgi:hypothetical protein